jgi:hypothetical protein
MYQMKCPECGVPLTVDGDNPASTCAACGWPSRPDEAKEESESAADEAPRRRKKRRRRSSDDMLRSRPRGHLLRFVPLIVVGLFACLAAVLLVLTLAKSMGVYWLGVGGVALFIVGALWGSWAAKADGIELWTPWEGTGFVATFQALMQLVAIPVIAWVHLTNNFVAALPPTLVLLMGIGLTVTAVILARFP